MQQGTKSFSSSVGMDRDTHPSVLKKEQYTFAKNVLFEETGGSGYLIQNEPSNIKCLDFPEGYKVVGVAPNQYDNYTLYFLTNGDVSMIGKIDNTLYDDLGNDISIGGCDGCNKVEELDTTKSYCAQFVPLMSDECDKGRCLNFSLEYPFKKGNIQIKREKCGTVVYFTDFNNPPRYINLYDLEQYKYIEIDECTDKKVLKCDDCNQDLYVKCPNCDLLRIFPLYKEADLQVEAEYYGGNLPQGSYEVVIAYSDVNGNEVSGYFGKVPPARLFDHGDLVQTSEKFNRTVGYGLRVKVQNLDSRFKYYKVGVIYRAPLSSHEQGSRMQVFAEGVHPTTDTDILLYDLSGLDVMTINDISVPPAAYDKTEMLATGNGYLFHGGLVPAREINLQPIFNLMGAFLKWRTVEATEGLYKDAANCSNYTGYLRDEVYPFGGRVKMEGGYISRNFVFANRPPTSQDLESFTNNDASKSVNKITECATGERDKLWQFFSTAEEEGDYVSALPAIEGEVNTISKKERKRCTSDIKRVENIAITLPNELELNGSTVGDYLLMYFDSILDGTHKYSELFSEITSYSQSVDGFSDCTPSFNSNCSEASLKEEYVSLVGVGGEEISQEERDDSDYTVSTYSKQDYLTETSDWNTKEEKYKRNSSYEKELKNKLWEGITVENEYTKEPEIPKKYKDFGNYRVYNRKVTTGNLTPEQASTIDGEKILYPKYSLVKSVDSEDLYSDIVSQAVGDFNSKLSNSAYWYKVNINNDNFGIQIKSNTKDDVVDDFFMSEKDVVRLSLYKKSNGEYVLVSAEEVDLAKGKLVGLKSSDFTNQEAYIAIDTLIVDKDSEPYKIRTVDTYQIVDKTTKLSVNTTPSRGIALEIVTKQYKNREVTIEHIDFSKVRVFESTCEYSGTSGGHCTVGAHKEGKLGYYESESKYPCNNELFDSTTLVINADRIPDSIKSDFNSFFSNGVNSNGNIILKETADLRNTNIRHYRFPDNKVSPFMNSGTNFPFNEASIYPIGVYLDKEVIDFFLDVAVDSGLLTRDERNRIYELEILRGDRSLHRSILAKGLLYDMYKWKDEEADVENWYSNYPYNDLGVDKLHCTTSDRNKNIAHPFASKKGNNKFTFHSPDTSVWHPKIGTHTEIMVDGYQIGQSRGKFAEVEGHPEWTILGKKAYTIALTLGTAESILETLLKIAELTIANAHNMYTGTYTRSTFDTVVGAYGSGTFTDVSGFLLQNAAGAGLGSAALVAYKVAIGVNEAIQIGKRAYEWQQILYNNGKPMNYSAYYSSEGWYNYLINPDVDTKRLRGISKHIYLNGSNYSTSSKEKTVFINNRDRESSLYLDLESLLPHENTYWGIDNNNSRYKASDTNKEKAYDSEKVSDIGSPYGVIKQWRTDLFGEVYDINWVRAGYLRLDGGKDEDVIFGGDTYLTRFSLKRKMPMFTINAMDLSMDVPFAYSKYSNVGYTQHYINFNTDHRSGLAGALFPEIGSNYKYADCVEEGTYVKYPTKFYLFYYGIPQFLVESDINCDFRYMGTRREQSFYPHGGDYMSWTQEKNISIKEDNFYLYNPVYTQNATWLGNNLMPIDYKRTEYECFQNEPNGVIYSLQDNNEKTYYDPNLYYRPLDKYEFKWDAGKLIDLMGIQSEQVFARFENHITLFNAVDVLRDRMAGVVGNDKKGYAGVFSGRKQDSIITDLGYGGTQHKEHVSCEYGIFFPDMRRGQVFQMSLGGSTELKEVTKGLRNWFKEHLPFKILKGEIEGLTDLDLDNKFLGLGVAMGWDSRFKRVFLTKKDFVVNSERKGKLKYENNKFYIKGTYDEVKLTDSTYFKDVSFTVAYSPLTQTWIGYYDFKPNYYVEHHNFFKTGINNEDVNSLWSHLVTNKSFTTFYGKKYPWTIEVPLVEESVTDVLQDVTYWMDSTRFHNYFDRAENRKVGMSKAWVYNYSMNTGRLDLVTREKNNLYQELQYPKHKGSSTEILATEEDKHWNFNTFYNRVRDEFRNVPNWTVDENNIDKTLNDRALYTKEDWKDRMRGDWFLLRLESDKNHSYKQIFKWGVSGVQHYF